jgi:hypothetical protein
MSVSWSRPAMSGYFLWYFCSFINAAPMSEPLLHFRTLLWQSEIAASFGNLDSWA